MTTAEARDTEECELHFDEGLHIYHVERGRRDPTGRWVPWTRIPLPSVTQVLNAEKIVDYSMVPAFMLEYKAEIGTEAHRAAELWDRGDLDQNSVDERVLPYLEAWWTFRDASGFEIEQNEQRLWHPEPIRYHPHLAYAGTVDRIGLLNGKRVVLEIKTTASLLPGTAIQCAAYLEAFNYDRPREEQATGRVAVWLRNDGTYQLKTFEDQRADFHVFTSALVTYEWKKRHAC